MRVLQYHNLWFIWARFEGLGKGLTFFVVCVQASSFEDFLVMSEQTNMSFIWNCLWVIEHHLSPNVFSWITSPLLPLKSPCKHGWMIIQVVVTGKWSWKTGSPNAVNSVAYTTIHLPPECCFAFLRSWSVISGLWILIFQ